MGRGRSAMWSPAAVVGVALCMLRIAAATQHSVGDTEGWVINVNYTKWVSQHTFREGDTMVFLYERGQHDVLRVSPKDYDSCSVSNPIETDSSGQSVFQLRTGQYYFICGFPGHCKLAQKLAFYVQPAPAVSAHVNPGVSDFPDYTTGESPAFGPSGAFAPGAAPASIASMQALIPLIFGALVVGLVPHLRHL